MVKIETLQLGQGGEHEAHVMSVRLTTVYYLLINFLMFQESSYRF